MTLHVSYDEFAETAKRVLGQSEAFVCASPRGTYLTAVHATESRMVSSLCHVSPAEAKARLTKAGMKVHDGVWTLDGEAPEGDIDYSTVHVAAVSYRTEADQPGIWVDAFSGLPTRVQVLRELYEEFRGNGEMPDVSFEEFVRLANPNVAIVSPSEIAGYLEARRENCPD